MKILYILSKIWILLLETCNQPLNTKVVSIPSEWVVSIPSEYTDELNSVGIVIYPGKPNRVKFSRTANWYIFNDTDGILTNPYPSELLNIITHLLPSSLFPPPALSQFSPRFLSLSRRFRPFSSPHHRRPPFRPPIIFPKPQIM